MQKSYKRGVTITEIITVAVILTIIGWAVFAVVSKVYYQKILINNLQKSYIKITQTLKQVALDNNCEEDLKCTKLFSKPNSNEIFGNEFVKYFDVELNCKTDVKKGCFEKINQNQNLSLHNTEIVDFDNEPIGQVDREKYKFITKEGYAVAINANTNNCSANFSSGKDGYLKNVCGYVYVDVNGKEKPNAFGRDVFAFYIANTNGPGLYPFGGLDDARLGYWKDIAGCEKNDDKSGEYCTGRIMDEDWQVKY